jgi:hypothetical protein
MRPPNVHAATAMSLFEKATACIAMLPQADSPRLTLIRDSYNPETATAILDVYLSIEDPFSLPGRCLA